MKTGKLPAGRQEVKENGGFISMKRKMFSALLSAAMVTTMLAGCGSSETASTSEPAKASTETATTTAADRKSVV